MKRHLIAALMIVMTTFALAGCSGSTGNSQVADESKTVDATTEGAAVDTEADGAGDADTEDGTEAGDASTEANGAATEGKTISPLPSGVDLENLVQGTDDCIVAVSIDEGSIYKNDAGVATMDVTLYDYDLYDMVDISQMQVGDTITICGEDVKITTLEDSNGAIVINGGIENGGYELMTEGETVYRATTWDDLKLFYEIGKGSFPVSSSFTMEDSSDLEAGTVTYTIDDILNGNVTYWYVPNNTQVRIAGGQIVSLTRVYNP